MGSSLLPVDDYQENRLARRGRDAENAAATRENKHWHTVSRAVLPAPGMGCKRRISRRGAVMATPPTQDFALEPTLGIYSVGLHPLSQHPPTARKCANGSESSATAIFTSSETAPARSNSRNGGSAVAYRLKGPGTRRRRERTAAGDDMPAFPCAAGRYSRQSNYRK